MLGFLLPSDPGLLAEKMLRASFKTIQPSRLQVFSEQATKLNIDRSQEADNALSPIVP